MVTIAQGKFSKPRPPRAEEPVRPVRKTVAADPIEKAEAEIARFMDTTAQPPAVPSRVTDETIVVADAVQVIPEEATRVIPQVSTEATQVIPQAAADATKVIPQVSNDATRVIPQVQPPKPAPVQRKPAPQPVVEEEYEEEPSFLERYKKPVLVGCCAAILLLVIAIIAMVISLKNTDTDDGRILNNVIAAGVNVGGMTPEQAKSALETAVGDTYAVNTMEVVLPDTVLAFKPEDTKVQLNLDAVIQAAYDYGRVGTPDEIKRAEAQSLVGQYVIDLLPYLQMNATYIHDTLEEYGETFNSSYLSSSFSMQGTRPGLTADTFDENAPCQTLILKIGTPGRNLDIENIYTEVLKAYGNLTFRVEASHAPDEVPDLPDLDAIFEEHCSTPVDAYMDMQTFAVTGEIYGYTFDLDAAKEKLANAEYGDIIEIPMEYILPEVVSSDLSESLYADVLGMGQTDHTNNADRNNNISLACQAINGTILQPGEEFSFNDVVGERTSARGYRKAPAYSSGETVSELGGGICQVSSTLYYSVLLAELDVTARRNHSYVSSYIDMGMDATVSWGGPEFKFRNNTNYPIRIEAEISGGKVTIKLLGTDKRDYYIEMDYEVAGYLKPETEYKDFKYDNEEGYADGDVIQEGSTGYVVDTYKHKIDKETGEKLGEEYVTRSSYRPHNEIIARVEPKPTEPPTEPPTTAPTEAPTEAPTTAPTEAPTTTPTVAPTEAPTTTPTAAPTEAPTTTPTAAPTEAPADAAAETEEPTEDVAG